MLLSILLPVLVSGEILKIKSADEWNKLVLSSPFATVVEFKSSLCLGCQEFEADWVKISENIPGVHFASVDIDDAFGLKLAKNLGVLSDAGVPALRIFGGDAVKGIPVKIAKAFQLVPKITAILKNELKFDTKLNMYISKRNVSKVRNEL